VSVTAASFVVRHRLSSGFVRVLLFTGVLAIAAAALGAGPVGNLRWTAGGLHLSWWLLAVLFFLTEVQVVHIPLRGEVHSFSLSEPAFIVGLFFSSPTELLMGQLVGAAVALTLYRRQPPLKVCFNLANLALGVCLAVLVFHALDQGHDPTSPLGWMAGLLASLTASVTGIVAVRAAMALSEGDGDLTAIPTAASLAGMATSANCSMGLLVAAVLQLDASLLWLLFAPVAILSLAYRAYMRERVKHRRIQFLYESTRILQQPAQQDQVPLVLLGHARAMFSADVAELILLPATAGDVPVRSSVGPGDRLELMKQVAVDIVENANSMLVGLDSGMILGDGSDVGRGMLRLRGLENAMVVPLRGERGVLGSMLVANRRSGLGSFCPEDLTLFETFASHAGIALENIRLERQLLQQAFHDPLTQLANRSLFNDRVEHALAQRDRGLRPLAILLLDLDDFKMVNDTLGHTTGDQLLVGVADRVRGCLRPGDTAARLGGDEFAVLLEDANSSDAMGVAERILRALIPPFTLSVEAVTVTASIGIVVSRAEPTSVDKLVARADVAMYHAKSMGKGRCELFNPGLQTAVFQRQTLRTDLERAVNHSDFVLHYQPLIDLRNGALIGVEALVRWDHAERGLVSPGDFVSLAEETGHILPIGRFVLEQACRQAAMWQSARGGHSPLAISVNVSVRQFAQPDFVADVARILRTTRLAPGHLILEITESVMVDGSAAVIDKLHQLKALGIRLAIDDFGTGYSSLNALRQLPIDMLKIAKSFVDGLGGDSEQEAFARAILKLGRNLDLCVVAEGIETSGQAAWLRKLGCDLGQGFHFSRPLLATEVEMLLDAERLDAERGGSLGDLRVAAVVA
jgi:diguanylate cyclase (GGDEF)-like protein